MDAPAAARSAVYSRMAANSKADLLRAETREQAPGPRRIFPLKDDVVRDGVVVWPAVKLAVRSELGTDQAVLVLVLLLTLRHR
jgi:hypothetical protein